MSKINLKQLLLFQQRHQDVYSGRYDKNSFKAKSKSESRMR